MNDTPDLYEVLGLGRDADEASIRRAYRARAKTAHPDAGGTRREFELAHLAHDVLTCPERRARYDTTGDVSGGQADDADSRAFGILGEALMGIVQGDGDPVHTDVVAHLTKCFDARISDIEKKLRPQEKALRRTEAMKGRFKNRKKKANRIERMLDWQIAALKHPIEQHRRHIADIERAKALLADYEFRSDPAPQAQRSTNFFLNVGASTSAGSF